MATRNSSSPVFCTSLPLVSEGSAVPDNYSQLNSDMSPLATDAKSFFMRFMRHSTHFKANTATLWLAWLANTFGVTTVAYLIASGISDFDGLISLVGALFATSMSFQHMAMMWLYDNLGREKSRRDRKGMIEVVCAFAMIVVGTFVTIAGTYRSIIGITGSEGRTAPWSSADNSKSD